MSDLMDKTIGQQEPRNHLPFPLVSCIILPFHLCETENACSVLHELWL